MANVLTEILTAHEIVFIGYNPSVSPVHDDLWVAIAYCRCGQTHAPNARAEHLADVLAQAAAETLDPTTAAFSKAAQG